jgi:hypothetical protein
LPSDVTQYQAGAPTEQADTDSATFAVPLLFLQTTHANSNNQPSVVAIEEAQPPVLREKPKPVFQTNNESGS